MSSPDPTDQGPDVSSTESSSTRTQSVTAIVVAHNGERWIPALVAALDAGTTQPRHFVAVDTSSSDTSRDLIQAAYGQVVEADSNVGFGSAVAAGLAYTDAQRAPVADHATEQWIWLLHDDCAPAPDALERLLEAVAADAGLAVVGPKVRAWPRAKRLLEVGVSISGTGHRETGLEAAEYDQGQHDQTRDVLAVSSAGMLLRRDVWDRLGGFDPRLPLFRDDVDFGWRATAAGYRVAVVPAAVLFHAEAATRGVRKIDTARESPYRADREAALFTLLANSPGSTVPLVAIRLLLGSFLRALGFLLGKLPSASYDEIAALGSVLAHPGRLRSARADRARLGHGMRARAHALRPRWWAPYTAGLDNILARAVPSHDHRKETVSDLNLEEHGSRQGPLDWLQRRLSLVVVAGFTLAALVAARGLWTGGPLQGGALLPPPEQVRSWWSLYVESWHPAGFGSDRPTSPYVALLALGGTPLAGNAELLVSLLLLMAVPLTAVGAYLCARRWFNGVVTRVWVTAALALLPVVTGAVQAGRIGTVVATILLPWLFRAARPLIGTADNRLQWRAAFASGLWLAAISAFEPVAWPAGVALLLALALAQVWAGRARDALPLLLPVPLSLVALLPWSWRWFTSPSSLLDSAGALDPAAQRQAPTAWQLPFGRFDAPGAPWWLTIGLILAAVVALLRTDRRRAVVAWWVVLATGLIGCAIATRPVELPGYDGELFPWVGFLVVVVQAAAIMAAATAADGVSTYVAGASFGWRQPLFAVTAVLALAAPVLSLFWWMGVAPHGELERAPAVSLPAYVVQEMTESDARVLVLTSGGPDRVAYDVMSGDGHRLGDDSVVDTGDRDELRPLVADIFSTRALDDGRELAKLGIAYVVLTTPIQPALAASLDSVPDLSRASSPTNRLLAWQLDRQLEAVEHPPTSSSRPWALALQLAVVVVAVVVAAPTLSRRGAGGAP